MKISTLAKIAGFLFLVQNVGFTNTLFTDYDFIPKSPKTLTNLVTKPYNCKISSVSLVENPISIQMFKGNGVINGNTLNAGQNLVLLVHNMQVVPITASYGAEAQFTNLSPYEINVSCN